MTARSRHCRLLRMLLLTVAACSAIVYVAQDQADPPSRWDRFIDGFEAADKNNPPPQNAILFVGSSSIVFWRSLAEDMAPLTVINRGFGGSQMFELNRYRDRIVVPYKPRAVLVYEGDNDVAAGKQPGEILTEYRDFVNHLLEQLPSTDVYLIAVKPSISRAHLWQTMETVNNGLIALADEFDHVQFLDTATPMLNEQGLVKPDLLVDDGLHMNANGYAIWTNVVKPVLMAAYGGEASE